MSEIFTIPNFISLFRLIFCLWACFNFYLHQNSFEFFYQTCLIILLDALDGIVARSLKQATQFGAKFDIYADRIVELSFWLLFALLHYSPFWIFWFFLIRGLIVDFLTFSSSYPLGKNFLRASRFMRFLYGSLKLISFILLIFWHQLFLTKIIIYTTVLVCFLRALPVTKKEV